MLNLLTSISLGRPAPYLIRTYSSLGELVCDPTMGTGSTGVAALQEGRAFVGIESNGERFRIARAKIASHT